MIDELDNITESEPGTELPEAVSSSGESSAAGSESAGAETGGSELIEVIAIEDPADHAFLTTDFAEYTVTEGLLLCILIVLIISSFARSIKEGFFWLY